MPTSPTSNRNGWDGKLRISDINGTNDDDSAVSSEGEDEHSHPVQRHAVVQQGASIEGDKIEADEDLLADYEDDAEDIDLTHCRISSVSKLGLDRFKKVLRLCLRQNAVARIELPESLRETLEEVDFYDNLIKDIQGLEGMRKLKSLDLSFNKIKHLKNVDHLAELTDIYFVQNRISHIQGLEGLSKLRNLELGGNRIRTVENLETLTGLEELWLGKNKITEITGLSTLSNLKILSIQANRITTISGLSALTSLEELHISNNLLTSITGLESNTNLRVIDISSNAIAHLSGLDSLVNLEELWASGCQLASFEEVESQLKDKKELKTVYFEGNPLQTRQPVLYRNKVRLALPQVVQIDATFVTVVGK
ncbi:L domain-like protein [Microthyrium microscopicum]|uniref:L domain-like protein n=1 Tax=Microthyrium microscopicum TaxID=703497 RepID=A0A6A6UUP6_9PEZI|nr:L domain-like protein [Microthyrium microscopicum]